MKSDPDIVTRLRNAPWTTADDCNAAADEIERLRHDLDGARLAYRGAGYDRDRMRAERDEARRMYCEEAFCHRFNERRFNERCVPSPISNARQIAHNMKWDCFKEDTDV